MEHFLVINVLRPLSVTNNNQIYVLFNWRIKTQAVTFNSSGLGSINDSNIRSSDKILLTPNSADRGYGLGIVLSAGNPTNNAVTIYAVKTEGGAYTGTINVNYLILPSGN